MKTSVYSLIILVAVFILSSCKKENDITEDNDSRTGLELLVDKNAQTYCVLVLSKGSNLDTMVWQNTTGDLNTDLYSGWGLSGVNDYIYLIRSNIYPVDTSKFTHFKARFQMSVPGHSNPYGCSIADSILKLGVYDFTGDRVSINIGDHTYSDMSTLYIASPEGKLEILSVTKYPSSSGCDMVRVKAKFSEVQFGQYQCFEPAYIIKQGLIQMDYQVE